MNKIINSDLLYAGKFLELYKDTIEKDDKTTFMWERCSRKNKTKAVIIVPYHISENKFVLIKEYRAPINDYEIGFPAGLLDKNNELIGNMIVRELYEETGLGLNNILRISPFGYNSAGMSDESISIAYINVYGNISNKHQESTEDIHTFFASKDEIKHMLYDKNIKWGLKAWIICDMLVNGNPFE